MFRPRLGVVCGLLAVAGASGCAGTSGHAPPRAPVMGFVTLDGELLEQGVIRFVPTEGTTGPKTTALIDRGMFVLPADHGPVVGTHRVEILSTDTGGLAMDDEQALVRLSQSPQKQKIEIIRVPGIYNKQSRLVAQVPESGTSDLNFELVSRIR
jgi:hypothetical protein